MKKYNPTQLMLDSKRGFPVERVARIRISLFRKFGVMPALQTKGA